jgi:uncharacterized membrane protein
LETLNNKKFSLLIKMSFIIEYQNLLFKGVNILQLISYTISFLLIAFGIIKSAFFYIDDYINLNTDNTTSFNNARLVLGESSALALSFILGVEILKLFFIKTYKQLIIVVSLVIIKLLVSYFLLKEISDEQIKKK